ncbi:TonB family protein [Psychrobacter sp. PP-21]|uniref:energy transducer TonB n=1 Tax=Psychrobacter sp. PP-21 TaxID=2957503 RepID=UPI0029A2D894|nr:TonB family protein [Psychrobacter sp. PP-21]MDX2373939.1 TonB family protein [Psychrobacter sp. PP-21]
MSSTELDAPPIRSILLAIITVVGLHLLTAFALVTIKTPTIKPEPETETPPVEIQFVTLPTKSAAPKAEVLPQEVSVQKPAQPTVEPQPTTPPKAETLPKQRVKTPIEPVVKKKVPEAVPVIATEQNAPDSSQKPLPEQAVPKKISPEPIVDTSAADERRKEAAAQAKKAAQDAEAKAAEIEKAKLKEAELKAVKAAQEARSIANAKAAAQAKAARDAAEAAARAKAEAEAAAAAQSNEPVSFTASAANWASAPNFSFPERAARRARSGDTLNVVLVLRVNKQGGIDSVSVAQSSGNSLLDREAQRQVRSGKFKPFTKNGVPVVGNVTLPISYAVP